MSVIKMVKAMIVTAALVFALAITSYADGDGGAWIRDSNGWWYVNANRSYTTDNWQQINGNWYYFDSYGYLVTGWKQSPHDGKWYYLDPNGKPDQLGRMLTNQWIGDYYVGADGAWVESGSNSSAAAASSTGSKQERLPASVNGYYITKISSLPIKRYGNSVLLTLWNFDFFAGPNGGLGLYVEYDEDTYNPYDKTSVDLFRIQYSFFNENGQKVYSRDYLTKALYVGQDSLTGESSTIELPPSVLPPGKYSLLITVTTF